MIEDYKKEIEVASLGYSRKSDKEIDMIVEDAERDPHLTEDEKEELWEFADKYKVHD